MKLIYRIFDNSGRKLKTFLRIIYLIEAICILLAAIGVLGYGVYTAIEWEEIGILIACIAGAPIGAFLALFILWLLMLPTYSMAELVCSAQESKNELQAINKKLSEPIVVPSPVAAPAPVVVEQIKMDDVTE